MVYKNDLASMKQFLYDGLGSSGDVETLKMNVGGVTLEILFVKSLCDEKMIHRHLFEGFWRFDSVQHYEEYLISFPGTSQPSDLPTTIAKLLDGHVAVFLQNAHILIDCKVRKSSPVSEATIETVIQGPQDAFNEDLMTSLNLIRNRYKSPHLIAEFFTVGERSQTEVALLYDDEFATPSQIEAVRSSLEQVKVKVIQAVGHLQRNLTPNRWGLFPMAVTTERPDRVAQQLSKGKLVILLDGTPFGLIAPSIFTDFFVAMDDQSQIPIVGYFLYLIRFIGFLMTMMLPGIYIGIVSYNPEFFRVQLAFSIAASRAAVPYPSYLEVLFMLLMTEFLTEASIRLPRSIGPTATTVGGLILGEAATQAGLISNIMVIITAVVQLSNFVVPILEMNFAIRIIKYFMVLICTFFGLTGLVLGLIGLVCYLCTLKSFGEPYVQMFRKADRT